MRINITLRQLEILLQDQKEKVIQHLAGNTYLYNPQSTDGSYKSIEINKDRFKEVGLKAEYPDEFKVLKKYIVDE